MYVGLISDYALIGLIGLFNVCALCIIAYLIIVKQHCETAGIYKTKRYTYTNVSTVS